MMCYENSKEEEYENGKKKMSKNQKNPDDDERNVDPGTSRNRKNPTDAVIYVSNIFTTGITSEWVMSKIEYNLATPWVPSSVRARIDYSR